MKKLSPGEKFFVLWTIASITSLIYTVLLNSFTLETVNQFQKILWSAQIAILTILVLIAGISVLMAHIEEREVEKSRHRCKMAHKELFLYVKEHGLKGFNKECQTLQEKLRGEVRRHCLEFPSDFYNDKICHYRDYCRKVEELQEH